MYHSQHKEQSNKGKFVIEKHSNKTIDNKILYKLLKEDLK